MSGKSVYSGYWLGAYRSIESNSFKWIDDSSLSYSKWKEGEPNNKDLIEDFAYDWYNLTTNKYEGWNDINGGTQAIVICELKCSSFSTTNLTKIPTTSFSTLTTTSLSTSIKINCSTPIKHCFEIHEINDSCTHIRLANKNLKSVDGYLFRNLSCVQYIDLSKNQLSSLDSSIFNGLTSLQMLDLSYNQLSSLDSSIFNGLTSLQMLYLHNNQLSSLDSSVFNGLTNLHRLFLFDNQLDNLYKSISYYNLSNPSQVNMYI
jgi:Leucine-rich repeat (LRR) protein